MAIKMKPVIYLAVVTVFIVLFTVLYVLPQEDGVLLSMETFQLQHNLFYDKEYVVKDFNYPICAKLQQLDAVLDHEEAYAELYLAKYKFLASSNQLQCGKHREAGATFKES